MNAILLTVLALSGADATSGGGPYDAGPYSPGYGDAGAYAGEMGGTCDQCNSGGRHGGHLHDCLGHERGKCRDYLGPMPQSCYNPSFGCYPSTRFMNRYPAFHNTYYRAAYNYRQYFDYPWHAGLHEPTSMFSYHTPAEASAQPLPTPLPESAQSMPRSVIRQAGGMR